MPERDGCALIELASIVQPKIVIEFGVNEGRTANSFLNNVPSIVRYVGVDAMPGHTMEIQDVAVPLHPGGDVSDPRFELIVRPHGTLDLKPQDLPRADLIFIDGDHGRNVCMHDSWLAYDLVNAGGIVIWHDYGGDAVTVTSVIDELHADGWNILAFENSLIAFERFMEGECND